MNLAEKIAKLTNRVVFGIHGQDLYEKTLTQNAK